MGTHSAMVIIHPIKTWEVERTLDGSMLTDAARRVVDNLIETGELVLPDVDDIGAGSIEYNEEREHNQEYFMAIDPRHKLLWLDPSTLYGLGRTLVESCRKVIELYDKRGWEVRLAYDITDVKNNTYGRSY